MATVNERLLTNGVALKGALDSVFNYVYNSLWERRTIPDTYTLVEVPNPDTVEGALKVVATEGEMEYDDSTGVDVPTTVLLSTLTASNPTKFPSDMDITTTPVYVTFEAEHLSPYQEIYLKRIDAEILDRLSVNSEGQACIDGQPIEGGVRTFKGTDINTVADPAEGDLYFDTLHRELSRYYVSEDGLTKKWEKIFTWVDRSEIFETVDTGSDYVPSEITPSGVGEETRVVVPNDAENFDPNTQVRQDDVIGNIPGVQPGDTVIVTTPAGGGSGSPTYREPTTRDYPDGTLTVVPNETEPVGDNEVRLEDVIGDIPDAEVGDHVTQNPPNEQEISRFPTREELHLNDITPNEDGSYCMTYDQGFQLAESRLVALRYKETASPTPNPIP